MLDCPVCERKNIQDSKCPQCSTDLTPLLRLTELPTAYYIEGVKFAEQGDLSKAIERLMTAASLNSDSASTYVALGRVYTQKGSYDEAIAYYKKALDIDPENKDSRRGKKEAEKKKKASREIETKNIRHTAILKKIAIGIPVIAFFIGLLILPITRTFLKEKPKVDYNAIANQVKEKIFNYSEIASLNVKVTHNNERIFISGAVPTELHKDLIKAMAKNIAGERSVSIQNLSVIPPQKGVKKEAGFLYTIRSGDTLRLIAYRFYGDGQMWNRIYELNRDKIKSPDEIFIGDILLITNK